MRSIYSSIISQQATMWDLGWPHRIANGEAQIITHRRCRFPRVRKPRPSPHAMPWSCALQNLRIFISLASLRLSLAYNKTVSQSRVGKANWQRTDRRWPYIFPFLTPPPFFSLHYSGGLWQMTTLSEKNVWVVWRFCATSIWTFFLPCLFANSSR